MYFLSSDESECLDDESDDNGSESRSSGMHYFHAFYLHFDNFVGSISGLGSDVSVPTGVKSKGDIFAFDVFIPTGDDYKGGRLIKMFWLSNSLLYFQI